MIVIQRPALRTDGLGGRLGDRPAGHRAVGRRGRPPQRLRLLWLRGQLVRSQVERADTSPSHSGASAPFCWSPGSGGGAWGVYVHTPSRVLHGVGYPDWSQRSYGLVVDDEALDLFLIAGRDPAQVLERYSALTGRAPDVPRWSLGVWIARADECSADDTVAAAADLRARRVIRGRRSTSAGTRDATRTRPAHWPGSSSMRSRWASASSRRYRFTRRCFMSWPPGSTC